MKIKIILDTGDAPMNYEANIPNQATGEDILKQLYNGYYSDNHIVMVKDGAEIKFIVNCERLVWAGIVP